MMSFRRHLLPLTAISLTVLLLTQSTVSAQDFVPPGERGSTALKGGPLRFWPERPDQAQVMTVTFLGGKGHDWLVAGGFQPDGSIVAMGNVAGGTFELSVKITVLGTDGQPPRTPEPGKNKHGKPLPYSWKLPGVTGFIAFLSPDAKSLKSAVRLPWDAGSITSGVVDATGHIYIAGKATDQIARLGNVQVLPVSPDAERKGGGCDQTFLAKLSPDGNRVLWVRHLKGLSDAPTVSFRKDGNLTFAAQDVRTFDPSGRQLNVTVVPGGVRETSSVSPIDGTIVRGGERHSGTGREPWRCPILNIHEPDGSLRYELYNWGGPYVGLDNLRQVSDSAVRLVTHDKDGNILFVAWSDGGNSVMTAQPMDPRRSHGLRGTGLNSAGAGVTSFAYLVKLEPDDYQVIGWTFWCTRYAHKANGINVKALGQADDGSFCMAGGSAWGLIQTNNFVGRSEPGGSYIAVLTPDMSGVRFSSSMPGTGAATVGNEAGDDWGIASGSVNGKPRVLFFAGATEKAEVYEHVSTTPTVNAMQSKFGGGDSDGYLVMLDLSKGQDTLPKAVKERKDTDWRLNIASAASTRSKKSDERPAVDEGRVANFSAAFPRYLTVDVEVRDAEGNMWPQFLHGKPVDGTLTSKAAGTTGSFTVLADRWTQSRGKQDRRVLGELFSDDGKAPPFQFTVKSLGPPVTETFTAKDNRGRDVEKTVTYQVADAVIEVGSVKLNVKPKCVFHWNAGARDGAKVAVRVNAYVTVKGRDLGLKKLADKEIDLRITAQGYDRK